ncbi:penicillin acylase family protein [Paramagnetospirillum kuznetsovii]|uniref:Penicillin acylase family protein n=2 Tax=Paramagnetospirillum kuznetsovii TaxID=2053833 RepID=A0A364P043_9PROT|nr:penicillin acylase family protein [Paramagnetospirillum kuznetsovii]
MLGQSVALVVLLALSVLWVVVMSSLPRIEGTMPLPGIHTSAAIARDSLGVPRITAKSLPDAYFALGWVHAQDRMWQMEMQRRVGAGRLAEVVGEAGLSNDRFTRSLGLYRLAERAFPQLDEPTRAALVSYAAGVNAWMKENRLRLPPEYTLLGFRPEPWTPADSMVWQKLMALQLAGNWHDDILRAQLNRSLDPKRVQELFPATPADAPVTLSSEGGKALLDGLPEAARTMPASNIWVVGGNRTESGKPLLANDPHLGFRAPILWYLAALDAPDLSLSGATVPGVPFHVIAHNTRIAWGFTATQADTVDLFVEKLAGESAYKTPEGSRPFVVRDEVIRVKGAADVALTVRETRHGPVISDLVAKDVAGPGEVVALSATLLGEQDFSIQALRKLNQAKDWAGFTNAVKDLQAPVLNIGYADTAGNIGFYTAGRVPIRKSGNGMVPARGWTNEGDWTGWVPFAKLPQSYNPKSALLINANNKVVGDKYPYLITATWDDGYRASRIRDLLEPRRKLTPADMSETQGDIVSLQALELKDLLSGHEFKGKTARDAAQKLADWDGRMARDRAEPLIYASWLGHLNRAVFADELKERFEAIAAPRAQMLLEALTRRRHWCDDVSTPEPESCEDMIERALEQALADLAGRWGNDMAKWSWGATHRATFDNAVLGKVPLVANLANLAIATDGDNYTVSRGSYVADAKATEFPQNHGAGLRAVFDLGNLANSRFVIATGQSGLPLSRHYADMMKDWQANRLPWPTQDKTFAVFKLERGR